MWHSPINFDNILFVIANDNNISQVMLQNLLEHNDFPCKLVIKIIFAMLIFSSNNNKK
jgi:hypothetical protein